MTRALIVDDEALARERIRTLLGAEESVQIIGECTGGRAGVTAIEELRPDLVFLDVQMPDLNGFEVLETVNVEPLPAVIFVTAHDEYALRAFDVHALDYVLKPIEPARFAAALARVRADESRLRGLLQSIAERPQPLDRLVIRSKGKILFVKPNEIDWIEADGRYAKLHVGKETHVVRHAIKDLATRLAEYGFVRVHRSAIVNAERIKELEPWFHGEYVVILTNGVRLTSSAAHAGDLHRLADRAL
jgi:two-component system LytT family response regulator